MSYLLTTYHWPLLSRPRVAGFKCPVTAKLPHVNDLIFSIEEYRILPHGLVPVFGYALPPLELWLGALLVLGIFRRVSAAASGLLVLSFTIAKVSALARGLDIQPCSCFGPSFKLLAAHSLAIDFVLLALAVELTLQHRDVFSLDSLLLAKGR